MTTAQVLQAYSYDVNAATGTTPITFSLVTFPASMTIDSGTGVISWTPAKGQEGSQSVTVRATNDWGTNDQSYTITVTGIIESCSDDPGVVGATYKITADISATGTCLVVGANGITIDGQNHILNGLSGGETGLGIDLNGMDNLVLKYVKIYNFENGIYDDLGSSSVTIQNSESRSNSGDGIYLEGVNNIIIKNNLISNNVLTGIFIPSGSSITIQDNTILGNSEDGIQLGLITGIIVTSSTIKNNLIDSNTDASGEYGIYMRKGTGNVFYNNNLIANYGLGGAQARDIDGNTWDNGPTVGGNYWDTYDTPAEGCNDVSPANGFCDAPYSNLGVVDDYPFTAGV